MLMTADGMNLTVRFLSGGSRASSFFSILSRHFHDLRRHIHRPPNPAAPIAMAIHVEYGNPRNISHPQWQFGSFPNLAASGEVRTRRQEEKNGVASLEDCRRAAHSLPRQLRSSVATDDGVAGHTPRRSCSRQQPAELGVRKGRSAPGKRLRGHLDR